MFNLQEAEIFSISFNFYENDVFLSRDEVTVGKRVCRELVLDRIVKEVLT